MIQQKAGDPVGQGTANGDDVTTKNTSQQLNTTYSDSDQSEKLNNKPNENRSAQGGQEREKPSNSNEARPKNSNASDSNKRTDKPTEQPQQSESQNNPIDEAQNEESDEDQDEQEKDKERKDEDHDRKRKKEEEEESDKKNLKEDKEGEGESPQETEGEPGEKTGQPNESTEGEPSQSPETPGEAPEGAAAEAPAEGAAEITAGEEAAGAETAGTEGAAGAAGEGAIGEGATGGAGAASGSAEAGVGATEATGIGDAVASGVGESAKDVGAYLGTGAAIGAVEDAAGATGAAGTAATGTAATGAVAAGSAGATGAAATGAAATTAGAATTVAAAEGTAAASGGIITFLISNPIGWVILAILALGLIIILITIVFAMIKPRLHTDKTTPAGAATISTTTSYVNSKKITLVNPADATKIAAGEISKPLLELSNQLAKGHTLQIQYTTAPTAGTAAASAKTNETFEMDIVGVDFIKCTDTKTNTKAVEFPVYLSSSYDWTKEIKTGFDDKVICTADYYPSLEAKIGSSLIAEFPITQLATFGPKIAQEKITTLTSEILDANKKSGRSAEDIESLLPISINIDSVYAGQTKDQLKDKILQAYGEENINSGTMGVESSSEYKGIHVSML